MKEHNKNTKFIDMKNVYKKHDEHYDENSTDFNSSSKDYNVMEHLSNARLMPMTGPYGGLDLIDTYEYGSVPKDPATPLESHDFVMKKNIQHKK